jgi:phosphoenolpyruvate carboxykinase (diphosphate)
VLVLAPPLHQTVAVFVDGIENIAQAMENSAKLYFEDGIINDACPPLKAVLHVMAHGHYNGKSIKDPEIRALFTRESLLSSKWYNNRLLKKQSIDIALWTRHVKYLEEFMARPGYEKEASRLHIDSRLAAAKQQLAKVSKAEYVQSLVGTIGADPIHEGYEE